MNLLIPRRQHKHSHPTHSHCFNNILASQINLLLHSHSLSSFLTSQPNVGLSISSLSKLNLIQTSRLSVYSHLTPITTMLVSSYLNKDMSKAAFKVRDWMFRSGCLCRVEKTDILVDGFCMRGLVFEALRVLGMEFVVNGDLRKRVFRSLMREATIKEAKKLDDALGSVGNGEAESTKTGVSFVG